MIIYYTYLQSYNANAANKKNNDQGNTTAVSIQACRRRVMVAKLVFDLIYLYRMYPVVEIAQTMTQQNGNCVACAMPSAAFASRKRGFLFGYERRKRGKGSSTAEKTELPA